VQTDSSRDALEVSARFALIPTTAAFADAFCARHAIERAVALRLRLVIEELFTNTVNHGYGGESDAVIRIALALDDGDLVLQYEDAAPAFDPRERWSAPPAGLDQSVDDRPVGGLGVHLVGELVRDARYSREAGHNRLTLVVRR